MTPPLVSVIMNCYNGEAYLRQAIDSVIAQTYPHWEIVFWDNQSTDGSRRIVESYGDVRIRYFHAPAHTPLYEARNHAIEQARGDYVAFLDVDDWWDSTKLEQQIPLFADPAVGMVAGNYWIESELRGRRWVAHRRSVATGFALDALLAAYYVGVLTLVVRRAALDSLAYACDPRYSIIGDFDLVIRLALGWKLEYVQEPVAHYRVHAGNELRLRRERHIEELETWLGDVGRAEAIQASPGLRGFVAEVEYAKALHELLEGRRWAALARTRAIPFGRFKARMLAGIFLPGFMIRRLKN